MAYTGSEICLVREDIFFDPSVGSMRAQTWEGTEVAVHLKAQELQLDGWRVRMSFDNGKGTVDATTPELAGDGETLVGAGDQWDFATEFIDVDYWASPVLFEIAKGILGGAATNSDVREYLSVIRRTINQQLQFAYNLDGTVILEADGSKSVGPTAYENFRAKGKDGSFIPDGVTQLFAKDAYEWAQAGIKTVQTSLVSITRRRRVPVASSLRFKADSYQFIWTRARFISDFSVPSHIQLLLPPDPTLLPFVASIWGYKFRAHEAQATSDSTIVSETTSWTFGAWDTQVHFVDPPLP
jgi:hypothetical protein